MKDSAWKSELRSPSFWANSLLLISLAITIFKMQTRIATLEKQVNELVVTSKVSNDCDNNAYQ